MKLVFAIWAASLFLAPIHAASPEDMASFDKVWQTIKDRHWNLEATGVDWAAMKEKYRPKAEKAENRTELHDVINGMIGELGQSHFHVYGSGSFNELEGLVGDFSEGGPGTLGIQVALVDDQVYVVDLTDEAAKQGLSVGCRILELQGKPLAPVVTKIKDVYSSVAQSRLYLTRTLNSLFEDFAGKTKKLKVADGGKTFEVSLTTSKPAGEPKQLLNLPTIYFEYESRVLPSNVGYMAFNVFIPEVKTRFDNETLKTFAETDGMIIDLRGNGGGIGFIAVALANRLLSENAKLGVMNNTGGSLNFAVFPQKPIYDKPLAVLIDGGSASTSEIFAAGLQDLGRARVFGTRSAGAALPSIIELLPNGDRFQYAIADYVSEGGRHLEGNGVKPDEETPHTAKSLGHKQDAAMEAALAWIRAQKGKSG